ncbi:MAG: hypothetical protein K9N11_02600 [Lentisphaeria bacterium]|nr:hypothetical protein [Candidatus Neomarinimicrobiota bacterium]MCF7841720.1 hypothetical protein [Lentisphaeria bacterium]
MLSVKTLAAVSVPMAESKSGVENHQEEFLVESRRNRHATPMSGVAFAKLKLYL